MTLLPEKIEELPALIDLAFALGVNAVQHWLLQGYATARTATGGWSVVPGSLTTTSVCSAMMLPTRHTQTPSLIVA